MRKDFQTSDRTDEEGLKNVIAKKLYISVKEVTLPYLAISDANFDYNDVNATTPK